MTQPYFINPSRIYFAKKFPCICTGIFIRCHPDSDRGMKVLQTFALPLGYGTIIEESGRRDSDSRPPPWQGGALPTELLPHKICRGAESNHRHGDFQSPALPTELPRHIYDPEGARTLDLQRDRLAF